MELENGYQFGQYAIHSDSDAHQISVWPNSTKCFNLDYLNKMTPRIHYLNMFSCSACRYRELSGSPLSPVNVPNIGTTYIFNNNYVLNITGSTGPWGFMPDAVYWSDIGLGKPIGEAFRTYFERIKIPTIVSVDISGLKTFKAARAQLFPSNPTIISIIRRVVLIQMRTDS